jgi:glutaryl-CoA dehydrogenase
MTITAPPPKKDTYSPLELFDVDRLLDDDERDIGATVRRFVDTRLRPNVAEWFESASLPRELAREFGQLGVMGMHLTGYGCAGTNAVSYGLACMELEAGDSGFRSFVSVQGSLSMFSIWRYGSEEQKQQWLPKLAAGEAIGCFGLTEADFGSNPAGMRTRARRDGGDWVINGTKMWITNGNLADVSVVSSSPPTQQVSPPTSSTRSSRFGPRSPLNSSWTMCDYRPLLSFPSRTDSARRCPA